MSDKPSWLNIFVLAVLIAPTFIEYAVYTTLKTATRIRRYVAAYRAGEPIPNAWDPKSDGK